MFACLVLSRSLWMGPLCKPGHARSFFLLALALWFWIKYLETILIVKEAMEQMKLNWIETDIVISVIYCCFTNNIIKPNLFRPLCNAHLFCLGYIGHVTVLTNQHSVFRLGVSICIVAVETGYLFCIVTAQYRHGE